MWRKLWQIVWPKEKPGNHEAFPLLFWHVRQLVAFFLPALFLLVLLEGGLRLAGYKFTPWDLTENLFEETGEPGAMRTRAQFRTSVPYGFPLCHDQEFTRKKPKDTLRLAIVGGSNVKRLKGADDLRARVSDRLGRPVEMINIGIRACGSDRAIASVRETLGFDIDQLLIYMGHNEFVSFANPTTYLNAEGRVVERHEGPRLRFMQLFTQLVLKVKPPNLRSLLKRARNYSEADKELFYRQFGRNLETIISDCRAAGVPVVLASVGYSYAHPPAGTIEDKPYGEAVEGLTSEEIERRLARQPDNAFYEYAWGRILYDRGEVEAARALLDKSFLDAPRPSRANRRINEVINKVSRNGDIPYAPIREEIEAQAAPGLPGEDFFSDRCHLNEAGKEVLAEVFAEKVVEVVRSGL